LPTTARYTTPQLIPPPMGLAHWTYMDQASALGGYIGPADAAPT